MNVKKYRPKSFIALFLMTLLGSEETGATVPVWYTLQDNKFPDSVYIAHKNPKKPLYGPIGDSGIKKPRWIVDQWNIPTELPKVITPTGNGWEVENADAKLEVSYGASPADSRIMLTQNGQNLACGTEYDLFVSPVSPAVYPEKYRAGMLSPQKRKSKPLSRLKSLMVEFDAAELNETVVSRCGMANDIDYGYAVVGIVLTHLGTHQSLYYQIILRDTRAELYNYACDAGTIPWWWSGPVNYGINDTIAVYGANCLTPGGGSNHYQLDILDRLKQHIASAPHSLNKNLSRWKITGLYMGTGIQGSTTISTSFGQIHLIGEK